MIHRIFFAAAWLVLAYIAFVTLSPLEDRPVLAGSQVEHFVAFAVLGFAFVLGYPRRTLLTIAVVIGSAFVLEAMQMLTPDRHGRVLDALVKAAGGICGIGIGHIVKDLLRNPFARIKAAFGSGRSS